MATTSYAPTVSGTLGEVTREPTQPSMETQSLLLLGKERGWDFAVLGRAPMPQQPVQLGDWLVVPAAQDDSHIPARAWERLHAIRAAGLRPQGFVLVHEIRKSLPDSAQAAPREFRRPSLSPALRAVLTVCGVILTLPVLAMGLAFIVAAVAMLLTTALAIFIVPAILLAGLAGLDPILVAVTHDGYWIELDRWDV